MSSSDDDDEAFDAFLASLKPVRKEKYRVSSGSLDNFIVDDSHLSFEDSSSVENKETDHDRKIQKKKGKDFHESYISETHEMSPIEETNDILQIKKTLSSSTKCSNGDETNGWHSTSLPPRKTKGGEYNSKLHQGDSESLLSKECKTKSTGTKHGSPKELLTDKELLPRKITFSGAKGNRSVRKYFTPKRSTACSSSVTSGGAFSTPRIVFSSDSDSDEETSGLKTDKNDNVEDRYHEKSDPVESRPSEDIDQVARDDDGEDTKLGTNRQNFDSSIENLCSDFEQVDLEQNISEKELEISNASPLSLTKKRSKILIYSDDSESDDDVILVESDKENLGRNISNRGLSSFEEDSNVFFTPTPIRNKPTIKPIGKQLQNSKLERVIFDRDLSSLKKDVEAFLTPTLIRKKTPLQPNHILPQSTNATSFVTSASTGRNALLRKDGLPPNLPRNCYNATGFKRHRDVLTKSLYEYFNKTVFEGKLPKDMIVEWDKRLLKTAGVTKCSTQTTTSSKNGMSCIEKVYSAKICLSEKVLDSLYRLRDTLCHEMCHAAVWLIENQNDGHGPFWRGWARKAMAAHPEMPVVRRCHSYDISYKFHYQCTMCRKIYGRHSKSIKVDKQVCGVCKGRLVLLPAKTLDGTPVKVRQPNKFAMFVKENYTITQKSNSIGGVTPKHSDVMKALSKQFASLSAKK